MAAPVISSDLSIAAQPSLRFEYHIQASGEPQSFGATGLPAGLNLNAEGTITGVITTTGVSTIGLSATNDDGTGTATLTLTTT